MLQHIKSYALKFLNWWRKPPRLRRLMIWVCWPLFSAWFMIFLADNRPYNHYTVPPLAQAQEVTGVLIRKAGRKWTTMAIRVRVGDETYYFGCTPNSELTVICINHDLYKSLLGKVVRVKYFEHKNARYYRKNILQLETGGTIYVNYKKMYQYNISQIRVDQNPNLRLFLLLGLIAGLFVSSLVEFASYFQKKRQRSLSQTTNS